MTLNLKRTENPINRIEREGINDNWSKIERSFNNVVDTVSDKAYNQVIDAARLIWQEPVDTFADLATTYPNAEEGWAAMAREVVVGFNGASVNRVYRYDGAEWKEVQQILADAVNEVDYRLTMGLAQVEKNSEKVIELSEITFDGAPLSGVSPVVKPSKVKVLSPLDGDLRNLAGEDGFMSGNLARKNYTQVLAPLDGDAVNAVTGVAGTVTGTLTYANVLYNHKGARFDGGQLISMPLSVSATIPKAIFSMRFKTLQAFNSALNLDYQLASIFDSTGVQALLVRLNYLDADNINGLEIRLRNGANQLVTTVANLNLTNATIYHLSVSWDYDDVKSMGRIFVYVNGILRVVNTFTNIYIPFNANELRIGNTIATNRPAQAIISDVFFSTHAADSEDVTKLATQPLNLSAVYDGDVYNNKRTKVQFYEGVVMDNGKLLTIPITATSGYTHQGAVSVRIKPLQNFNDTLNAYYQLLTLVSPYGNALDVKFNYLDNPGYNGIEVSITSDTATKLIVANKLRFDKNKPYTIGVEWYSNIALGTGYISIYVNGVNVKTVIMPNDVVPINIYEMRVGNLSTLDKPAMCAFEAIFYNEETIGVTGHLELHRKSLKLESLTDGYAYKPEYEVVGYKREQHDVIVLNYFDGKTWGIRQNELAKLLVSYDDGITWSMYHDFTVSGQDSRVQIVELYKNYLFVFIREGEKGYLKRSTYGAKSFSNVLQMADGRFPANGWNWSTFGNNIAISEYGQNAEQYARLWVSSGDGAVDTWSLKKTLGANTHHFHACQFDPYTGYLWQVYGDGIGGIEYSPDLGNTWVVVDNLLENKGTPLTFTKDAVIVASDYYSGGAQLRIYNKYTGQYSRLAPQPERYLNHVYGIHLDTQEYLWWFGNREEMPGKVGTFHISPDYGATHILLEDIGNLVIPYPLRFVQAGKNFYFGNQKITRPIIKKVTR